MFTVHKRILPYFHVPNKHYLLIASKFIDPQNQFNLRYPVREHTEQGLVFLHGNKKKVHSFKTKRDKLK